MSSIPFFILGFVVASVIAQNTTETFFTNSSTNSYPSTASTASTISFTEVITTKDTNTGDERNAPNINSSTIKPSTTQNPVSGDATGQITGDKMTTKPTPTPGPIGSTTSSIYTTSQKDSGNTSSPLNASSNRVGIIILIVIILVAAGFLIACYMARKRGRRYSVDFTSRQDEVNIPLSTVEPEMPGETAPQNGLQTFESTETTAKESEEPEAKPEAQAEAKEEQKVEADKSVADPSTEPAAPAPAPPPAPDSSEDKPKADVVEQSPPTPAGSTVEEKTDDGGPVSNKTSEESQKETNENNSNNADFSQKRNLMLNSTFWEVPLDCPV